MSPERNLPWPPALRLDSQVAVFLDFDGTLVDIAERPDGVAVPDYLPGLIQTLSDRLDGRLAIITGRSLDALEALLGKVDIAMAGSHGGEFRPDSKGAVEALAEPIGDSVVRQLTAFAHDAGGLLVEPKPFSVAVHYRRHPGARDALLAQAQEIAAAGGLRIKHGKHVVELVMPGSDKGSALDAFMARDRFAGSVPVFLGDDVTDEDAFRALAPYSGTGILVGDLRETAAGWHLPDVSQVHAWLAAPLGIEISRK